MFKGLANLASLMKQAQSMGGKMREIQAELQAKRVTGEAGGGMVTVEVNGLGEILKLTIDPQLIERGEREMIEDLTPAAVNQAIARSKQLHVEAMKSMTGGVNLPGLDDALSKIAGMDAAPDETNIDEEEAADETRP